MFVRRAGAARIIGCSPTGVDYLRLINKLQAVVVDGERIYRETDVQKLARERARGRAMKASGLKSTEPATR